MKNRFVYIRVLQPGVLRKKEKQKFSFRAAKEKNRKTSDTSKRISSFIRFVLSRRTYVRVCKTSLLLNPNVLSDSREELEKVSESQLLLGGAVHSAERCS